jgi:hypothetical protein
MGKPGGRPVKDVFDFFSSLACHSLDKLWQRKLYKLLAAFYPTKGTSMLAHAPDFKSFLLSMATIRAIIENEVDFEHACMPPDPL